MIHSNLTRRNCEPAAWGSGRDHFLDNVLDHRSLLTCRWHRRGSAGCRPLSLWTVCASESLWRRCSWSLCELCPFSWQNRKPMCCRFYYNTTTRAVHRGSWGPPAVLPEAGQRQPAGQKPGGVTESSVQVGIELGYSLIQHAADLLPMEAAAGCQDNQLGQSLKQVWKRQKN